MSYTISIKEVKEDASLIKRKVGFKPAVLRGCEVVISSNFPNQKLSVIQDKGETKILLACSGEMTAFVNTLHAENVFQITVCGEFTVKDSNIENIPHLLSAGAEDFVLDILREYLGSALLRGLQTAEPVFSVQKGK
ncbi:hypothetical protein [Caudoviricetes sp.]|nr:hypothetical protein [Caudoviricetes sp.]